MQDSLRICVGNSPSNERAQKILAESNRHRSLTFSTRIHKLKQVNQLVTEQKFDLNNIDSKIGALNILQYKKSTLDNI